MIISQARKGQRLRIQHSGHCIGCSPKARLRASPQALEAVYEQERQSFLTVAIRQDAFGSGFWAASEFSSFKLPSVQCLRRSNQPEDCDLGLKRGEHP